MGDGSRDSGQIDSGQIDSGQIDSGQIDSGQIDSGQIDSCVRDDTDACLQDFFFEAREQRHCLRRCVCVYVCMCVCVCMYVLCIYMSLEGRRGMA